MTNDPNPPLTAADLQELERLRSQAQAAARERQRRVDEDQRRADEEERERRRQAQFLAPATRKLIATISPIVAISGAALELALYFLTDGDWRPLLPGLLGTAGVAISAVAMWGSTRK